LKHILLNHTFVRVVSFLAELNAEVKQKQQLLFNQGKSALNNASPIGEAKKLDPSSKLTESQLEAQLRNQLGMFVFACMCEGNTQPRAHF
jgi:hypothetical protein